MQAYRPFQKVRKIAFLKKAINEIGCWYLTDIASTEHAIAVARDPQDQVARSPLEAGVDAAAAVKARVSLPFRAGLST